MKGSITVEAAFLCPCLCLILWAMIVVTLLLYETVKDFGEEATKELYELVDGAKIIRIERMLCEDGKE